MTLPARTSSMGGAGGENPPVRPVSRCPHCRAELDLPSIFGDEDLRAVLELRGVFGDHGRLVFEYCELFGVTPLGKKTAKLRRLLTEMSVLWQAERFTANRKTYDISRAGIAESLKTVVNRRFDKNLTNHNYLKSVMVSVAERQYSEKSKAEERTLRARENDPHAGARDQTDPPFNKRGAGGISPDRISLDDFKALTGRITKNL